MHVSAVYLVVSGKELDEDIQKDFLSFCSRSHARKKGDWLSRILEWTISKIQLRGNFSDESMYKRGKLYK